VHDHQRIDLDAATAVFATTVFAAAEHVAFVRVVGKPLLSGWPALDVGWSALVVQRTAIAVQPRRFRVGPRTGR
jgi:hypothetical protein